MNVLSPLAEAVLMITDTLSASPPPQQFTAPAVIDQLAYVLIACGAITFFLSFLGYCGAIRESTCLLYTVS